VNRKSSKKHIFQNLSIYIIKVGAEAVGARAMGAGSIKTVLHLAIAPAPLK
jgi:hypothetical protein